MSIGNSANHDKYISARKIAKTKRKDNLSIEMLKRNELQEKEIVTMNEDEGVSCRLRK